MGKTEPSARRSARCTSYSSPRSAGTPSGSCAPTAATAARAAPAVAVAEAGPTGRLRVEDECGKGSIRKKVANRGQLLRGGVSKPFGTTLLREMQPFADP